MAHPYQKYREHNPGRAAVKRILKADGGSVASDEEMARAKNYMRGMKVLGAGTWSGKDAYQHGADSAKAASDRMRPNASQDDEPKRK